MLLNHWTYDPHERKKTEEVIIDSTRSVHDNRHKDDWVILISVDLSIMSYFLPVHIEFITRGKTRVKENTYKWVSV